MLNITSISMRNFFSFGNAPQVIEMNGADISLVLGQNNDAVIEGGDSSGRRNGVGKSAIIQGLVYGLFGKSIGNDIKIPNLVNKTNAKNCEVIVEFEKDGVNYRVERGRSPTYFNFITVGTDNTVTDESRGEKKDTQEDLNEILGISQLLFEHIVVLNANVEPFLALGAQRQRDMIEELLGITQLTEKAELLKDMNKESKRLAEQEKFKNETVAASNERIQKSIESLQEQANNFEIEKSKRVESLESEISLYSTVNFEDLYKAAALNEEAIAHNLNIDNLSIRVQDLASKFETYNADLERNKSILAQNIDNLKNIDINAELKSHEELEMWKQLDTILKENNNQKRFKEQKLNSLKANLQTYKTSFSAEDNKRIELEKSKCPTCLTTLEHNEHTMSLKAKIQETIDSLHLKIDECTREIEQVEGEIGAIEIFDMPPKPITHYNTLTEAQMHEHKLQELQKKYDEVPINIYQEELMNSYDTLNSLVRKEVSESLTQSEVREIELAYNSLKQQLERELATTNTFISQINTLTQDSLVAIDYSDYNNLDKLANHQDFLVKLLLNKDSYVRKRIIEQNISYLNNRLQYYIEMCGSEHSVVFLNDLSVEIEKSGQYFDYKQLSRGERTRVNIALSCAFRDTYESLYQSINILIIDEMIDQGLDSSGVLRVWSIFQDMSAVRGKNVYAISHREELLSKTEKILKVVKEYGFSTVEYTTLDDVF
ncbi:recombination endonuclease subunit [Escherichia phage vB_EcoM_JNE01]|nr:recombination endonuclease subunit [Escherichia phage vB_EcoM_JNE01]